MDSVQTDQRLPLGEVQFNVIGLVHDLRHRGLSNEDAWRVIYEISDRDTLYQINENYVPPVASAERRETLEREQS